MKVLFCFYPLFVHYNHGVALLSQLCRQRGIETELYMLDDVDKFAAFLTGKQYAAVCFSAVIERDYTNCVPFMRRARARGELVLLGGVYPRRGVALPNCPAHLVCRGDGESLPDFLLQGDDRLFQEQMIAPDLNALPLPDYELFKNIPFDRELPFMAERHDKKVLPYYSSRGCRSACTFCEVRNQNGTYRLRRNVGTDLRCLSQRYQPDLFMIGDETLPYYDKRWRESWGNFHHPFVAYLRGDCPVEQLAWLKERGLSGCAFGVESGDETYRNDVLKKGLTDEELLRTVEQLNRLDIPYAPFYMTGLPGESMRQQAATHKMREQLGGFPVTFQYENLKPSGRI